MILFTRGNDLCRSLIVSSRIVQKSNMGSAKIRTLYFYTSRTLLENSDWLEEQLGDVDDDYILFDCPGQIELYTHLPVMNKLIKLLDNWRFR